MRDYSLPEALGLSFFSKRFYQSVAATWRGRTAAYLFLLTLLTTLPSIYRVQRSLDPLVAKIKTELAQKIPQITVEKGEVHTPESKAYELRFGGRPTDWILIDPTGQTTSLAQTTATILVTKNQVMVRKSPVETRIYSLANVQHLAVNAEQVDRWILLFRRWFPVVFYPFLMIVQGVLRLFEAVLLAIFGLAMVSWIGAKLDFSPLFSLAVVAMTPSLILSTLLAAFNRRLPADGLLSLMLIMGYYLYAINSATDFPVDEEPLE